MSLREYFKSRLNPSEWIKDLLFGGVGAVALSIVYQFFEILKRQPDLLMKWGPNFMLWILAITIVGVLFNNMLDHQKRGQELAGEQQERLIEANNRMAEAQQATASAQNRLAECQEQILSMGNRQLDEIQTTAGYAAAQNEQIMAELREQKQMMLAHYREMKPHGHFREGATS